MSPYIIPIFAMLIPIVAISSKAFNDRLRIKHSILKDEIELEKLKQQSFIAETERLRLEIEQVRSSSPLSKDALLEFKPIQPDLNIEPTPISFKETK
ncbi:hypothetical protein MKZ08_20370 [Viridibacillus sp. FSL R5-0477]|uniref:Uncharacterized protein n=1 Tax=Viridibacillus arenosi FSL R5-213 TaxID=1227360 RepID=W4F3H0_9BACL|nr:MULTISPECIES: hypothetical protein [Viridibacillus]ETT87398.1 hypothetical protein C176_04578 [Viridibacillus arenosi FSL R5-213]OMC82468.1 hypothetical protein BK130_10850 [Viridibacillus sp. FSL H8-0123]OMC87784.1 hypothetical protein BK128_05545 [Viridibacillus sp. FSL H7-0596]OMC91331.1 hypothetical protein BK137_09655 [Viridibacillus arenosi]